MEGVPRLLSPRRGPVDARVQFAPIPGRQRPGVRRHGDLPRIAGGPRTRLRPICERSREVEAPAKGLLDGTRPEYIRADRGAGKGRRRPARPPPGPDASRPCVRVPTSLLRRRPAIGLDDHGAVQEVRSHARLGVFSPSLSRLPRTQTGKRCGGARVSSVATARGQRLGGAASLRERESWPSLWQRVKRKDRRIDSKTRRCCASSLVRHAGAGYWPRDCGSTPAKVRKSVIRNVPLLAGNVGCQRGCVAR